MHAKKLALVAIAIPVAGILSLAACGGKTASTSSAAPAVTHSQAAAKPAAPMLAALNTPVRDGKFQFTITSVTQAKSVGDTADGLGDTAQGEYTILHLTVENIGTESQTFDDTAQYVSDANGRKYDASTNADIDINNSDTFLATINPGNSAQVLVAFDLPAGVIATKAELHDLMFSGGIDAGLR